MGTMKGRGEGEGHNEGAKRTIHVEWEFRGTGGGVLKEKEVKGTEQGVGGTKACVGRTRTTMGLGCLMDSGDSKYTKPKKK